MENKLTFSGHDTFHCRHFWLKKGYDFIKGDQKFSDPNAVIQLGVGKNMVNSIKYWMTAFGLLDEDKPSDFANRIFSENGYDPFLEDIGTLWLLHYNLVKSEKASIYSLVYNQFRKERIEFTRSHLESFINKKCNEEGIKLSENSIRKDVNVFLKNYILPQNKSGNIEDDFSAILIDLDLIQEVGSNEYIGQSWYLIESAEREEIPNEIILFAILDNHEKEKSISLMGLLNDMNSVGCVFSINASGLIDRIQEITKSYPDITFTDDAGIKELQIKNPLNKWKILDQYYAN